MIAARRFGRITWKSVPGMEAPRLSAASVKRLQVDGSQPGVERAVDERQREHDIDERRAPPGRTNNQVLKSFRKGANPTMSTIGGTTKGMTETRSITGRSLRQSEVHPEHGRHHEDEAGGDGLERNLDREPERAAELRVVEHGQDTSGRNPRRSVPCRLNCTTE